MRGTRRWSVQIFVGEDDGRTYAEAALVDDIGNRTRGTGHANLAPTDHDVPEIGDEIAVARALNDLSRRLLGVAEDDVAAMTHERVRLHR
jgi:Rv2632c-like